MSFTSSSSLRTPIFRSSPRLNLSNHRKGNPPALAFVDQTGSRISPGYCWAPGIVVKEAPNVSVTQLTSTSVTLLSLSPLIRISLNPLDSALSELYPAPTVDNSDYASHPSTHPCSPWTLSLFGMTSTFHALSARWAVLGSVKEDASRDGDRV